MTKLLTSAAVAVLFAGAAVAMDPPAELTEMPQTDAAVTDTTTTTVYTDVETIVTDGAVEAEGETEVEAQGDGEAEIVEDEAEVSVMTPESK